MQPLIERTNIVVAKGQIAASESVYQNRGNRQGGSGLNAGYGISNPITRTSAPGFPASSAASLYYVSPVVNSMIQIGADQVSTVPLVVGLDTDKGFVPRPDTLFSKMLNWVNRSSTLPDFVYSAYGFYKTFGVTYVAVELTDEEHMSLPGACRLSLWLLNPLYVEKVYGPNGSFLWKYTPPTSYSDYDKPQGIVFAQDNVLEMKSFNPLDFWLGSVNIGTLADDIRIERAAKQQMAAFYENASKFVGVLSAQEDLNDDQYDELDEILNSLTPNSRRFRNLILEKGQKYEAIQTNGTDQHFGDVLSANLESHSMVLGIPIGMLHGVTQGSGDISKLERMMWTKTLTPWLNRFCAMLSKHLGYAVAGTSGQYADNKRLTVVPKLRSVPALQSIYLEETRILIASMTTGGITPNQFRQETGRPHYEDEHDDFGDVPLPKFKAVSGAANAATTQPGASNNTGTGSPSMSLPGGGKRRDQSNTGEAQMPDTTGQKGSKEEQATIEVMSRVLKIYGANKHEL